MAEINKKHLEHLANLARMELHKHEEEKFLKDLEKVLGHFQELNEVNTDNIQPMTGGTYLKNVLREDKAGESSLPAGGVVDAMPEKEKGYLRTPPVFD